MTGICFLSDLNMLSTLNTGLGADWKVVFQCRRGIPGFRCKSPYICCYFPSIWSLLPIPEMCPTRLTVDMPFCRPVSTSTVTLSSCPFNGLSDFFLTTPNEKYSPSSTNMCSWTTRTTEMIDWKSMGLSTSPIQPGLLSHSQPVVGSLPHTDLVEVQELDRAGGFGLLHVSMSGQ